MVELFIRGKNRPSKWVASGAGQPIFDLIHIMQVIHFHTYIFFRIIRVDLFFYSYFLINVDFTFEHI